jgi:hypothetical protein
MSKQVQVAFALVAAATAVGAALSLPACEGVPLTAAPGTTMTVTANPDSVPANGGVSVVTAILVEPAGTFVPDGTEVFFSTDLGRVDPSGKSVNGYVRVNFVSDARSGDAHVTAVSGGPAPAPSGSPSPTPTPTPTPFASAGVTARSTTPTRVLAAGDVAADTGTNQASTTIHVGTAQAKNVLVTANPSVLSNTRSSTIVANVFDANGNPVQNVPVIFEITAVAPDTAPMQESLDSGGSPRYTDSNGQAFDTLTTKAPVPQFTAVQKTVTVTATTPNGVTGTASVTVNYTSTGGRT